MTKYVKLNPEHTEWKSALFSSVPPQVRRLNVEDYPKHNWFTVEEHFPTNPDRELYRFRQDTWELIDDVVHVHYVTELIDLEQVKDIMCSRVMQERDRRLSSGLTFKGYPIDTDVDTFKRVTGAVLSTVIDSSFTTDWITADNQTITLDATEIQNLGKAFTEFERTHIMHSRTLKDQILTSVTPQDIDYKTGWPEVDYI